MSSAKRAVGASSRADRKRQVAAVGLAPALEPVVDLCLKLGLTSPEMERVLRSVFVRRAEALLADSPGGLAAVTDVRVSLIVGVHRSFIRRIRRTRPIAQLQKVQRRHRGAALLNAWSTDWQYVNASGQPRDLPIRAPSGEVSFAQLVRKYMAGVSMTAAIAELRRSGAIRLLPDELVRLISRTPRLLGPTDAAVTELGGRLKKLSSTLLHNLKPGEQQRVYEELEPVWVPPDRLPMLRQVIARRARNFIDSLSAELGSEPQSRSNNSAVNIGVVVYSHEGQ